MKLYEGLVTDMPVESWTDIPCPYTCERDIVENIVPDEYQEIVKWCESQEGAGKFFWSNGSWYFERIEDATWFTMRWVVAYD